MNISEVDLKKLWAKAAGRCSYPGCPVNCIEFFEMAGYTVLGEMAHVIPQGATGPRATGTKGPDTYENLILLCPTHHTTIDKAPSDFPAELLHRWKREHEENVQARLAAPRFESLRDLAGAIDVLLLENHAIWKRWGPDSDLAKQNPVSFAARFWTLRKLSTVVPNNTKIVQILQAHENLIPRGARSVCIEFSQHVAAFERNCYHRMDGDAVPRFPITFAEWIDSILNPESNEHVSRPL